MRITCPNCGAQYEVDDALIPEAGRDVQCSNCGKGWFQSGHAEPEEMIGSATAAPDEVPGHEPEDVAPPEADEVPEAYREAPAAAPATALAAPPAPQAPAPPPSVMLPDDEETPPPPAVEPRKPDEAVLAVLREEAAREIAQRRQETTAFESQPDLGLAEPVERRTTPSAADMAAGAAVAGAARRDLLPDIDEINSTLRADADRSAAQSGEPGDVQVERRRGFRTGFGLVLLLVAALIGLYVGSGWLAQTVPALAPVLAAYVDAANAFRGWLDGLLAAGTAGLSG